MTKRFKIAMSVALLAATVASTATPTFAAGSRYCKEYAKSSADAGGIDPLLPVLGLALIGTGVGAAAGVAISGLAITTGALGGGVLGVGVGSIHANKQWQADYNAAYTTCRESR